MGVKLQVVLEPFLPTYTSGQEVAGSVRVTVDSVTACRAILAKVKGCAEVVWKSSSEDSETETERTETEILLEESVTVWSGVNYGGNLMPGEFSFPFSFRLPIKLAPTFEGRYGHVRYSVEALAEVPWGQNVTCLERFIVKGHHDLNEDPKMAETLPLRKEDTICCWCCEEGPVVVYLSAEKSGYVAGEYILITGEITNNTTKAVDSVTIKVLETISFNGGLGKEKTTTLREVQRPGFSAGGTDVWLSIPIHIPDFAMTFGPCQLIDAKHNLEVHFDMGWSDVIVTSPFTLGTIPVGKLTLAVEGSLGFAPPPSAPPLSDEYQPIMQQPQPLPPPNQQPEGN